MRTSILVLTLATCLAGCGGLTRWGGGGGGLPASNPPEPEPHPVTLSLHNPTPCQWTTVRVGAQVWDLDPALIQGATRELGVIREGTYVVHLSGRNPGTGQPCELAGPLVTLVAPRRTIEVGTW